jgi:3-hydroxybutyryl-CoA dehydratase
MDMDPEKKCYYFQDFEKGAVFKSSTRLIGENEIDRFADLSGDTNPIHVDQKFAEGTVYGERIAHGLLTLSIVSGQAVELGIAERTTIAFKSMDWRFKKPVFIGDAIRSEFEVIEKRALPNRQGGLIVFRIKVFNQKNQTVQTGRWSVVIRSRS